MIKKFCLKFFAVLCSALMLSLVGGSAFASDTDTAIIFLSRSGNTEQLANYASELTGGDVYRIFA